METDKNFKPVEVFAGTSIEANMVKSYLENAGIAAFVKDDLMGTIAPWQVTGGGAGAVKVFVSSNDIEEVSDLLAKIDLS